MEVPDADMLEPYFGEYSTSAKAYRTQGIPDALFRELVKFLLEIGCLHPKTYAMPKNKAIFIIATYQGVKIKIHWGCSRGLMWWYCYTPCG